MCRTVQFFVSSKRRAKIVSDVETGAGGFGLVGGASSGVSLSENTVDNSVASYIDAPVVVTGGDVDVLASSTVDVNGLSVATSVAGSIKAGAGGTSFATIKGTVQAYIGDRGSVNDTTATTYTPNVTVQAATDQKAEADATGVAVAVGLNAVPIGIVDAKATIDGTTEAFVAGTIAQAEDVTIEAANSSDADSKVFALAGGIGLLAGGGVGADAAVTVTPTVNAYVAAAVGDAHTDSVASPSVNTWIADATVIAGNDVTVESLLTTDADADLFVLSVAAGAAIGATNVQATVQLGTTSASASVDELRDEIQFARSHNLSTSQR